MANWRGKFANNKRKINMKRQQMKIEYDGHSHNNMDWSYTCCHLCGNYLPPIGWRMAGGSEKHSSYIDKVINAEKGDIVGWQLYERPGNMLPLLLGNMIILGIGPSLVSFDIRSGDKLWETNSLGGRLDLASTPAILRPFLFLVTDGKLWRVSPDGQAVSFELGDVDLTTSTPVSIEDGKAKKAFFTFQNKVLMYQMYTNKSEPTMDWLTSAEVNLILRSPVIWNQQVFFTSANGNIYKISDGKLTKVISLGNGEFSSPMLLDSASGSWIVLEAFYNTRHYLYSYNLVTSSVSLIDLEQAIPSYERKRLDMWPIQVGPSQVVVSSYNSEVLYFVDLVTQQKPVTQKLPTPVSHWNFLGSQGGIVSVVDGRLQCIKPNDDIHPLSNIALDVSQQPFYLLANDVYLVLVTGQYVFWKEV
jgi:hypothetical protein